MAQLSKISLADHIPSLLNINWGNAKRRHPFAKGVTLKGRHAQRSHIGQDGFHTSQHDEGKGNMSKQKLYGGG